MTVTVETGGQFELGDPGPGFGRGIGVGVIVTGKQVVVVQMDEDSQVL